MLNAYSIDQLVEQCAIGLFATLGRQRLSAQEAPCGGAGARELKQARGSDIPTNLLLF
jgi:hypothetical protein